MNKPHIHAKLIKQWADGAKIQYFDEDDNKWIDLTNPHWVETLKYRIKPEPVEDIVELYHVSPEYISLIKFSGKEATLRLIFDGETKQLKKAEVL